MNLASSDIFSGVQGGSNVSSISTFSTPGSSDATRWMSSWIIAPAGQPIRSELGIVGHLLRRPRRVERQLDLHVLHTRKLGRDAVDVLLDHRPGRAAHPI